MMSYDSMMISMMTYASLTRSHDLHKKGIVRTHLQILHRVVHLDRQGPAIAATEPHPDRCSWGLYSWGDQEVMVCCTGASSLRAEGGMTSKLGVRIVVALLQP